MLPRKQRMDIRLVIFDMDGVIFKGDNFWLDLHGKYGTVSEGLSLANDYLDRNYDQLVRKVVGQLWIGKDASIYKEMIRSRRYQPGIRAVFNFIRKNRIKSAIISSGPYDLAKRAKIALGIDEIYANRLIIEKGRISGKMEVMVKNEEKASIGIKLAEKMGIGLEQVAFIGDGDNDIDLATRVGLPIVYNSKVKTLHRVCKYNLHYGELKKLVQILAMDKATGA
jgi:phosphoserine phosphatase